MKSLFLITTVLLSFQSMANSKFAEKLVIQEIEEYAQDYQVEELDSVKFTGIVKQKYTFSVLYKKNFCLDIGDDERDYCATYRCETTAEVDSDAVVSFQSESNSKNCKKIPGTDYTRTW